jgi:hypothetical protein
VTRYMPRTDYLPDQRQTYLHLPGVRPNYGSCPGCGVSEDVYCDPVCNLSDPYAYNNIIDIGPCQRCLRLGDARPMLRVTVLVLPHRPVKHLTTDGEQSLCGVARRPKAILYRGVPWG